jgi:hypothetical protein
VLKEPAEPQQRVTDAVPRGADVARA